MKVTLNMVKLFKGYLLRKRSTFKVVFAKHEMLVLNRYVKLQNDPMVPNVETLLTGMLNQQVEFVIDSLAEGDLVVDKLYPGVCGAEAGLA